MTYPRNEDNRSYTTLGLATGLLVAALLGLLAQVQSCSPLGQEEEQRGVEVENEVGSRIVFSDSMPAVGAKVSHYPVAHVPGVGGPFG